MAVNILIESAGQAEHRQLILTTAQYCEIKPVLGEIDEEQFDRLEEASKLCMAMRCGEHLLSYGANSAQMLARKIVQHGFSREVALQAAEQLTEQGLIDEERDLRREVEKCTRKLWGAKRIGAHLWNRGFASETMKKLPQMLEEVDFVLNCITLIEKHYGEIPKDAEEQKRLTAKLCRYGYSLDEIRKAFGRLR